MPHISLDRKIDLFDFAKSFSSVFEKSPLIKISTIYVEKNGFNALLPAVIIDEKHQEFLIEISTTLKKTTIRLFPMTDPVKTNAVKSSLVKIYHQIKKHFPDISISKTNLLEYLESDLTS
ncbi:hypothetical protein [Candidatus Nitrosopumilus sediminis]|uniref:Uncharacterized protein n=1 Tax=Candidatus Nitrosopumilus sediminis TaxID=1229909 RepID=K0BF74_9ARCH|nr:hypothetical protein [Candidatus Nitrosopumilus sediminis]AFS82931.1 hypothetical protein NSED_05645 [Candidatus Nitrosopumilus sediminis]